MTASSTGSPDATPRVNGSPPALGSMWCSSSPRRSSSPTWRWCRTAVRATRSRRPTRCCPGRRPARRRPRSAAAQQEPPPTDGARRHPGRRDGGGGGGPRDGLGRMIRLSAACSRTLAHQPMAGLEAKVGVNRTGERRRRPSRPRHRTRRWCAAPAGLSSSSSSMTPLGASGEAHLAPAVPSDRAEEDRPRVVGAVDGVAEAHDLAARLDHGPDDGIDPGHRGRDRRGRLDRR